MRRKGGVCVWVWGVLLHPSSPKGLFIFCCMLLCVMKYDFSFIFALFSKCLHVAATHPFLFLTVVVLPSPWLALVSRRVSAFKTGLCCAFFYKLAFGGGNDTDDSGKEHWCGLWQDTAWLSCVLCRRGRALSVDSYIAVSRLKMVLTAFSTARSPRSWTANPLMSQALPWYLRLYGEKISVVFKTVIFLLRAETKEMDLSMAQPIIGNLAWNRLITRAASLKSLTG